MKTKRVEFGLDMNGGSVTPRVDGVELSSLEWEAWLLVATTHPEGFNAGAADEAVRTLRAHFGRG